MPERDETDQSLAAEREKADRLLAERTDALAQAATAVVDLARQEADVLIEAAREQTDAVLERADEPAALVDDLVAARATEDELVEARRAAADERLASEQRAHQRAIKLLLTIERKETNQRLQLERERADHVVASRDDFLAIVSHDVRTILAGIALSADAMVQQAPAPEPARVVREAERIQRFTARMNRLVGDLLDLVGMEAGKLQVVAVPHDACELVRETLESFQELAATRGLALTITVPDAPVLAVFDHERLLQVLGNLVGNALKFTARGGHVEVALAVSADQLELTVRDDGVGIAPDQHEAIFERFSQASQRDRRGLGLGLYIARGLVEAHGGTLWVTGALGSGSTFHLTLPRA